MKVKLECGHKINVRADLIDAVQNAMVQDASLMCPKCKEFKKAVRKS